MTKHTIERAGLVRYVLLGGDGVARAQGWRGRCKYNVFVHRFFRGDSGTELHTHPYDWSLSLILWGSYTETRRVSYDRVVSTVATRRFWPGMVNIIGPRKTHRIDNAAGCWTLFVSGPKTKTWGMWNPTTFKYHNMSGGR